MIWIEAIAVVCGLTCVALTIRQNIWCWPIGLVQVTLYVFIFYQVKLYSDLILHLIYIALQIYGWHHWLHGRNDREPLMVSRLSLQARLIWLTVAVLGSGGWGYMRDLYTDASVPYGDAFTTVASLIAQWLLARKHLESWLFWIAVDIVAIGIYWHKELYLTSVLYAVFLVLATLGWFAWRNSLKGTIMVNK